jgi:signal transduction histidine kinase
MRFRTGSPPARRAMAPVLWSGLPIPLALVAMLVGLAPLWALYSVVAFIPLGFLAGLLRTRVTRSVVGELVVALAKAPAPDELRGLLARALGDPSLRLAFRGANGFIDASGAPIDPGPGQATTELPEAVLFHDPALLGDDGLVETVAAAARMALENARLQAEVRAQLEEVRQSRARVVESADAERRRIERDLHDGAQQQLLGLAISLRLLREELGDEASPGASALLEQASAEARQTLVEMRELARGIHPPVLVNDGLGPALHSLAERAALPVLVEAAPPGRLPSHAEVAAWFVCSECVANAVKHSHAEEIRIAAVEAGDELRLRVADDGIGGASLAPGGGLSGLRDRLEALGGTLEVESGVGRGTIVTAALPLAAERIGADTPA